MDVISRQAAIDAIDSFDVLDGCQDQLELRSKIEKLPSAKNKAFEEMKAELYEREAQAQADKELYPDNEYLEGVFDGLHEASKLMSIAVPTAEKKGKWIPASERLPEGKDVPFLCVSEYNPIPRVVNKFVTYAEGYAVEGELVAALRKFLSIAIKCDVSGVEDLSKWMKYLEKEHAERNKFESAFLEFFRIIAWMPLPEPYCGARMEE